MPDRETIICESWSRWDDAFEQDGAVLTSETVLATLRLLLRVYRALCAALHEPANG
jgi:hypothetical protein